MAVVLEATEITVTHRDWCLPELRISVHVRIREVLQMSGMAENRRLQITLREKSKSQVCKQECGLCKRSVGYSEIIVSKI
jgi:hypothetical protein